MGWLKNLGAKIWDGLEYAGDKAWDSIEQTGEGWWDNVLEPIEEAIPDNMEQALVAGAGAVVGGAVGGWGGAVAGASLGSNLYEGLKGNDIAEDELEVSQQELEIKREEMTLQHAGTFNEAKDNLLTYTQAYENLRDVQNKELASNIGAIDRSLGLWDEDYALQTGQIEAEKESVDTALANWQGERDLALSQINAQKSQVDTSLANWQGAYDTQMGSLEEQGRGQLNQLLSNWTNTEVIAAERGASGSLGKVAGQAKSDITRFAGSDMRLAGSDGLFGQSRAAQAASLNAQKSSLQLQQGLLSQNLSTTTAAYAAQKSQLENQQDLIGQNLDLTKSNLNAQKANWQDQRQVYEDSLASNLGTMANYRDIIGAQYGIVDEARQAAGFGEETMAGLGSSVAGYSDEDLAELTALLGDDFDAESLESFDWNTASTSLADTPIFERLRDLFRNLLGR